jgi:hypothetical protein
VIEDSQIVQETRKVRCSISERFGNDPDRYIDYLLAQDDKDKSKWTQRTENVQAGQSHEQKGQCESP